MPVRFVEVVRATEKLEVGCGRRASLCERRDVVHLEESRLGASPTAANERAACTVPRPDLPFDARRNVTRVTLGRTRRPRTTRPCQLLSFEVRLEQDQTAFEDDSRIPVRHDVPQ